MCEKLLQRLKEKLIKTPTENTPPTRLAQHETNDLYNRLTPEERQEIADFQNRIKQYFPDDAHAIEFILGFQYKDKRSIFLWLRSGTTPNEQDNLEQDNLETIVSDLACLLDDRGIEYDWSDETPVWADYMAHAFAINVSDPKTKPTPIDFDTRPSYEYKLPGTNTTFTISLPPTPISIG